MRNGTRLLTVGFTSTQLTPMQLHDRVQWLVRPRLLAVRGVAPLAASGLGTLSP